MRNFIWSLIALFCISAVSFSQTQNIEKGSYLSNFRGHPIKLNLLDDNRYEFFMSSGNSDTKFSGDYEVKEDSLLFPYKPEKKSFFNLICKNDKKAKKIKISFSDPPSNPIFIGVQNGSNIVQYKNITDFENQAEDDESKKYVFKIDRVDYLYLICENPNSDSKFSKFALPKDVSEIIINYQLDYFADSKVSGFFDTKSNKLIIAGRYNENPLVFINSKNVLDDSSSTIFPLENQLVLNWTYPGKVSLEKEKSKADYIIDSAQARVDVPEIDFKLKINNNLESAIVSTKEVKNKYLVVFVDNAKNISKDIFENFIENREKSLSYSMNDQYNPMYDIFNYYLTSAEDKIWIENNKIKDDTNIFVLNGDGDLLATAQYDFSDEGDLFSFSGALYKKLLKQDAFLSIDKEMKAKSGSEDNLIKALNRGSVLDRSYIYVDDTSNHSDASEFKMSKISLNKKELVKAWKKLIESHQKDTKPNMYLAEAILREINGMGFFKQFFDDHKTLNDTDLLSIDYLLKHYDAIEEERLEFNNKEGEYHDLGEIVSEINSALKQNNYSSDTESSEKAINNIIGYKKIIDAGKGNFETYKNYFEYFIDDENQDSSDIDFFKSLENYFDSKLISEKLSSIEKLDDLYTSSDFISGSFNSESDYPYDRWTLFKNFHSDLCHFAALKIISKPQNNGYIKKGIKWAEYSVAVNKNNTYYLTALAQLYYKDGQKDKAVKTQELVVEFIKDVEDDAPIIASEILEKMKNGTYGE